MAHIYCAIVEVSTFLRNFRSISVYLCYSIMMVNSFFCSLIFIIFSTYINYALLSSFFIIYESTVKSCFIGNHQQKDHISQHSINDYLMFEMIFMESIIFSRLKVFFKSQWRKLRFQRIITTIFLAFRGVVSKQPKNKRNRNVTILKRSYIYHN